MQDASLENMQHQSQDTYLYVIGFKISRKSTQVLYTLYLCGNIDQELIARDKDSNLLFCQKLENLQDLIEHTEPELASYPVYSGEPYITYDFQQVLKLVSSENIDDNAAIINLLNVLFDMVDTASIQMPIHIREILYPLQGHTTFHTNIVTFYDTTGISRQQTIDALYWCLGAVCSKMVIIDWHAA